MRKTAGFDLKQQLGLDDNQANYAKFLGKWMLGLGAAGATYRGLTGMGQLVGDNLRQPYTPPAPKVVDIPFRPQSEEDQNKKPSFAGRKFASDKRASFGSFLVKGLPGASHWSDIPLTWPTTALAGGGALYGGYKLVDKVVNSQRARMAKDETERARQEYEQAMLSQFQPIPGKKVVTAPPPGEPAKTAGLNETTVKALLEKSATESGQLARIAEKLDKLAELAVEKKAFQMSDLNPANWQADSRSGQGLTRAAGMYGIIAPMLMGASGIAAYKYTKDQDPAHLQAEALEKQRKERELSAPQEMYARLVPVGPDGKPMKRPPLPLAKAASDQADLDLKAEEFVRDLLGV